MESQKERLSSCWSKQKQGPCFTKQVSQVSQQVTARSVLGIFLIGLMLLLAGEMKLHGSQRPAPSRSVRHSVAFFWSSQW